MRLVPDFRHASDVGAWAPLRNQMGAAFGRALHHVRIHAALKTEARVGAQCVPFRRFANAHGVEPSRFQQHLGGRVVDPTGGSAIHPCQTKRVVAVGMTKSSS